MAIEQQNGDVNLVVGATVYNKTADAATAGIWSFELQIGDGVKDLNTGAGLLTLTTVIDGRTVEGAVSVAKDSGVLRVQLDVDVRYVANAKTVTITLLSSNASDTDVDVTVVPRKQEANTVQHLGTACPTPATAGVPTVDAEYLSGSQTAAAALAAAYYSAHADGVVVVADSTTDTGRAANLRTAYTAAKALTPGGGALSATNRAKVLIPPGRYDFGTGDGTNHGLLLDAEYVDLIGLGDRREDVVLTSQIATASRGTLEQTASDVRLKGFVLDLNSAGAGTGATATSAYFPATNMAVTEVEDVKFLKSGAGGYPMRIAIEYSGKFTETECVGSYGYGGGGAGGIASGTFTGNVHTGQGGFGGSFGGGSTATGIFINNTHTGDYGFGGFGTASGTFIGNTHTGDDGFGSMGTASGTFINNTHTGEDGFGGNGGTASGTFINNIHTESGAYGGGGTASGIFANNMPAGDGSYGGDGGVLTGKLVGCACVGASAPWRVQGATIEDSLLAVTTTGQDCITLLDSASRIHNSTLLVVEGGTGIPINAATALSVSAAGNRYNNKSAAASGLGPNVINTATEAGERQAAAEAALVANNLDHLAGTATGIPAVPAGTYLDQIMDDGTAGFDRTTDSLQAIRDTAPLGTAMRGTDSVPLNPLLTTDSRIPATAPPTNTQFEARTKPAADYADKSTLDTAAADVAGLNGAAMRGTDGAYTGTPPTAGAVASQVRTELTTELGRIDAAITTRTKPADTQAAVTTVGSVTEKTGYKLASDGLDSVSTTAPTGAIGTWNFRERVLMLFRWFFGKSTLTSTQLKTYAADGTTVKSTQTVSDDGTTQTKGEAS